MATQPVSPASCDTSTALLPDWVVHILRVYSTEQESAGWYSCILHAVRSFPDDAFPRTTSDDTVSPRTLLDAYGDTIIHIAATYNSADMLKLLCTTYECNVDALNASGVTALWEAVQHRRLDAMRALLELGADANAVVCQKVCAPAFVALDVHDDGDGRGASCADMLKMLVRHGANVNAVHHKTGHTLLQTAVEMCNTTAVRTLIELGCRVDVPLRDLLDELSSDVW